MNIFQDILNSRPFPGCPRISGHLTHFCPQFHKWNIQFQLKLQIAKKIGQKWVKQKMEIFVGSRISKFLRPAQRYDDFKLISFKLIRITCQAACHGKTEHGIFVKFEKMSKTAVVLIAGVTIVCCWCHWESRPQKGGGIAQTWATWPKGASAPNGTMMCRGHGVPKMVRQQRQRETNKASSARTQQHS